MRRERAIRRGERKKTTMTGNNYNNNNNDLNDEFIALALKIAIDNKIKQ